MGKHGPLYTDKSHSYGCVVVLSRIVVQRRMSRVGVLVFTSIHHPPLLASVRVHSSFSHQFLVGDIHRHSRMIHLIASHRVQGFNHLPRKAVSGAPRATEMARGARS